MRARGPGYHIEVEKRHSTDENRDMRMTTARTSGFLSSLIAMALFLAFIPGGVEASIGDDRCCSPEDPCCPDTELDDCDTPGEGDCCPSDCSVCLLTCCAAPASLLASPVTLEGNGESDGTMPLSRSVLSSTDANGIYHPPRR